MRGWADEYERDGDGDDNGQELREFMEMISGVTCGRFASGFNIVCIFSVRMGYLYRGATQLAVTYSTQLARSLGSMSLRMYSPLSRRISPVMNVLHEQRPKLTRVVHLRGGSVKTRVIKQRRCWTTNTGVRASEAHYCTLSSSTESDQVEPPRHEERSIGLLCAEFGHCTSICN